MRQHTERVSTQWSALLDALGELVSASHDNDDNDSDSATDQQPDDEAADVERAPGKKWLGRCADSAPCLWKAPAPQHESVRPVWAAVMFTTMVLLFAPQDAHAEGAQPVGARRVLVAR